MQHAGVTRFPGALGRIPNFSGAEQAAARAASLPAWDDAQVLKCNPDLPQRPLRWRALKEGKTVYMAVPRLTSVQCFVELDPHHLGNRAYAASSIKGAFQYGRVVTLDEMKPIDLVVCGAVAVTRHVGLLTDATPVLTTVHPVKIVDFIPMGEHDISLNCVATPDEIIHAQSSSPRPQGIYWDKLTDEKIAAIPVIEKLKIASAAPLHTP